MAPEHPSTGREARPVSAGWMDRRCTEFLRGEQRSDLETARHFRQPGGRGARCGPTAVSCWHNQGGLPPRRASVARRNKNRLHLPRVGPIRSVRRHISDACRPPRAGLLGRPVSTMARRRRAYSSRAMNWPSPRHRARPPLLVLRCRFSNCGRTARPSLESPTPRALTDRSSWCSCRSPSRPRQSSSP